MKKLTITQLLRTYKTAFDHIPLQGILLTRNKKPLGIIMRPDKKKFKKEVVEKAVESVNELKKIKLGTFSEVENKPSSLMGMCSKCGTQGEVVEKKYVNEQGVYEGKYLCLANCFNSDQGVKELPKVKSQETSFNQGDSDFRRSNEETTF